MGEFNIDGVDQNSLSEEAMANKGGLDYFEFKVKNYINSDKQDGENFIMER